MALPRASTQPDAQYHSDRVAETGRRRVCWDPVAAIVQSHPRSTCRHGSCRRLRKCFRQTTHTAHAQRHRPGQLLHAAWARPTASRPTTSSIKFPGGIRWIRAKCIASSKHDNAPTRGVVGHGGRSGRMEPLRSFVEQPSRTIPLPGFGRSSDDRTLGVVNLASSEQHNPPPK